MNVLFFCHNHPYHAFRDRPRGGELSVRIIMQHLRQQGHKVRAYFPLIGAHDEYEGIPFHHGDPATWIKWADVVFTWGRPAVNASAMCRNEKTPYIVMVRWWRNVCPLPPGDVLNRKVDKSFRRSRQEMYDGALAVVTNNHYAAECLKKHYNVDAVVSYVPIIGKAKRYGREDGALTLISPDKALGEYDVARDILQAMPDQKLIIVNPGQLAPMFTALPRTKVYDYLPNLTPIWEQTKTLLLPVYHNDICGTTRVSIEAMQHSVPVIANDRCGIGEKVPNLVPYNASASDWCDKIAEIEGDYEGAQVQAREMFRQYDTDFQLSMYDRILDTL